MWALLAVKHADNVHYFLGNKLASVEQSEAKNKVLVKEEERKEMFILLTFYLLSFMQLYVVCLACACLKNLHQPF
jgi:hypothetical protein